MLWESKNISNSSASSAATSGMYLPQFLPQSHHYEGKLAEVQGQVALSHSIDLSPEALLHLMVRAMQSPILLHSRSWVGSGIRGDQGSGKRQMKGAGVTYCTGGQQWRSCKRSACTSAWFRGLRSGKMETAGARGLPGASPF